MIPLAQILGPPELGRVESREDGRLERKRPSMADQHDGLTVLLQRQAGRMIPAYLRHQSRTRQSVPRVILPGAQKGRGSSGGEDAGRVCAEDGERARLIPSRQLANHLLSPFYPPRVCYCDYITLLLLCNNVILMTPPPSCQTTAVHIHAPVCKETCLAAMQRE